MSDEKVVMQHDSKERVAFDLMDRISRYEGDENVKIDKAYWFKLYAQCWNATRGRSWESK